MAARHWTAGNRVTASGYGASFQSDEQVLTLVVAAQLSECWTPPTHALLMGEILWCMNSLNKAARKEQLSIVDRPRLLGICSDHSADCPSRAELTLPTLRSPSGCQKEFRKRSLASC